VSTVAGTGATVLIQGESGTGKELVANLIHASSPRASKPLIKLNCAAIPETLLEDELFGHEKGAYTGAIAQRKGRFELAHGGTLFLDEIAEMPPHLQAKILRVLQEREFERVGGTETLAVDVRLIASTNRDIEDLVRQGEFREDLYYRINVVPIRIPPLRDRPEDIFILATHFLKKFSERNNRAFKGISKDARRLLLEYPWPGNVRELENCIERAVVMGKGDEITPDDILLRDIVGKGGKGAIIERLLESRLSVDGLEKELITEALKRAHWNQSKAAEMLGLTRRTLQYRMEKHQIVRPALKEGQEA